MKSTSLILRFLRPLNLLASILVFVLGAGIARYIGAGLDWSIFWLGLTWILIVQVGGHFFYEYFHTLARQNNSNHSQAGLPPVNRILIGGVACLAVAASLTVTMAVESGLDAGAKLDPVSYLFMLILFLGAVFYAAPPLRLEVSGFGELLLAFLLGFAIPGLAFTLQAQELNRLVPMVTFPLVLLVLVMLIAFEMPGYSGDLKAQRLTLMVRMGWKNAINLHNILILSAYLLVSLASFFGLPYFAAMAALLSLPISLFEIWQMRRISQGKPPNWRALMINAAACFASMAYLFSYAFWSH